MKRHGNVLSAAVLLAGYTIGTGFYAIPVGAGPAGFFPAAVTLLAVWLYLLSTGLLYMEAILISPDGANMTTISRNIIGLSGMLIASTAFIIINYIYISNFYTLSTEVLYFLLPIPKAWYFLGITLIFGGIVYCGTYASDRLNFILFIGLLIAFIGTAYLAAHGIKLENLKNREWYLVVFSVPIIITALDYQSMLPTLATYLKKDPKRLVRMIIFSMLFPLAVYLTWILVTIGSTTRGVLWAAFETSSSRIYQGFKLLSGTKEFELFFHFTSLFATATSLIATGLALVDFISDAFKIPLEKRVGLKRFYACLATYIPSLCASVLIPTFVASLEPLLGWAEVIFNGVIPIWLATRARYILKLGVKRLLPGGKAMIIILIVASFFLVYLEGVHLLHR